MTPRRLVFGLLLTAMTGAPVAGCGCEEAAADCVSLVRYDDRTYAGYSFLKGSVGDELGVAEQSGCDDTGCDPNGSYFPEDPDEVIVFEVEGYTTEDVIARQVGGRYAVLVNQDLPARERDALIRELTRKR